VVWWGVNEPWPGLAGNALLDFFGRPKLGWGFLHNAFKPVTLTLRYEHCVTRRLKPELWISNIRSVPFAGSYMVTVTNLKTGQEDAYSGSLECGPYHASYLKTLLPVRMRAGTQVHVACRLFEDTRLIHQNHYFFGSSEDATPLRELAGYMRKTSLCPLSCDLPNEQ
jgi:hypothetical protein